MLSKQLNKSSAEQVTIVFKNVDASSISTGMGVQLIASGASCDGVQSIKAAATTLGKYFIGISKNDVPVNGFGNSVCWGLADSVALSAVGTSITITSGDNLWPSGVAGYWFSNAANDVKVVNAAFSTLTAATLYQGIPGKLQAVDSITISGQAYIRAFVRAL